jgi:regulator of replication initiation timing
MSFENLTESQLVDSLRSVSDQLIAMTERLKPMIDEYDKLKVEFNSIQEELTIRLENEDE